MNIEVKCQSCGAKLRISDRYSGNSVPCKGCGTMLRVPGAAIPYQGARSSKRKKKKKKIRLLKPALCVGIPLIIAGSVWGLWTLFSGSTTDQSQYSGDIENIKPKLWNVTPGTMPQRKPSTRSPKFQYSVYGKSLWFPDDAAHICVVVAGKDIEPRYRVFDVVAGKELYQIARNPGWYAPHAMSADGRYIAGLEKPQGDNISSQVIVHDRGQRTLSLKTGRSFGMLMRFLPGNKLLTGANGVVRRDFEGGHTVTPSGPGNVVIWDLATGRAVREFSTPTNRFERADVSSDGKYLATIIDDQLVVFEVATGEKVGIVNLPDAEGADGLDLQRLRFSHDGTRLAGHFTEDLVDELESVHRILCWDFKTGRGLSNFRLDETEYHAGFPADGFTHKNRLHWTQNDRGIIVKSTVLDFNGGRLICAPTATPAQRGKNRLLRYCDDRSILIGDNRQIRRVDVPLQTAFDAQQAMESKRPAYVRPGTKVSLVLDVGDTRYGQKAEAEKWLRAAVTKRLKRLGIEVAEEQTIKLHVDYSEAKGERLTSFRLSGGSFGFIKSSRPDGPTVDVTKTTFKFSWQAVDRPTPLWEGELIVNPQNLDPIQEVSDQKAHQRSIEQADKRLARYSIPYFIAKGSGAKSLPVFSPIVVPSE